MQEHANLPVVAFLQYLGGAVENFATFLLVGSIDVEKLGAPTKGFDALHNALHVWKCRSTVEMHPEDVHSAFCQGQTGGLAKAAGSPKNQRPISHTSSLLADDHPYS